MSTRTAWNRRAGAEGTSAGDRTSAKKSPCTIVQRRSVANRSPDGMAPRSCHSITSASASITTSDRTRASSRTVRAV